MFCFFLLTGSSHDYDDFVTNCLNDGVHFTYETGRQVLKSALDVIGIGCHFSTSSTSTWYLQLQKHMAGHCFRCGDKNHEKGSCRRHSVHCTVYRSHNHDKSACALKFMPCMHCGAAGHYTGNYNLHGLSRMEEVTSRQLISDF
jgi:hypothetical protein